MSKKFLYLGDRNAGMGGLQEYAQEPSSVIAQVAKADSPTETFFTHFAVRSWNSCSWISKASRAFTSRRKIRGNQPGGPRLACQARRITAESQDVQSCNRVAKDTRFAGPFAGGDQYDAATLNKSGALPSIVRSRESWAKLGRP